MLGLLLFALAGVCSCLLCGVDCCREGEAASFESDPKNFPRARAAAVPFIRREGSHKGRWLKRSTWLAQPGQYPVGALSRVFEGVSGVRCGVAAAMAVLLLVPLKASRSPRKVRRGSVRLRRGVDRRLFTSWGPCGLLQASGGGFEGEAKDGWSSWVKV